MTRGQRNKNPFNIIRSKNAWKGKVPHEESTDNTFEQFYDIDYGLRAGIVLLVNYIRKGYDTPRKIISRYAPACENYLPTYLFFIGTYVPLDDKIFPYSESFYLLCVAICKYESETSYTIQNFKFVKNEFMLS